MLLEEFNNVYLQGLGLIVSAILLLI